MIILTPLLLLLPTSLAKVPQNPFFEKDVFAGNMLEIPIVEYPSIPGLDALREADHATVAMNDNRDILVAFHTSRPDITLAGNMKQVEFAYFEYRVGANGDEWEHLSTEVVGGVDKDPLFYGIPTDSGVKCERPDAIAVGNRFCVVWTRRYDQSVSGDVNQPAVLECAWIEKDDITGAINVYDDPLGSQGQGFILDFHDRVSGTNDFWVKECAGVPDAVVLNGNADPTIAVVYPHQKNFSNPSIGDLDRKFELRVVTCSIDSNNVITGNPATPLISTIPFNGPDASAGLILPDVAPSPVDNAFWLVAESQVEKLDGSGVLQVDGSVRLDFWRNTSGTWTSVAGRTFQTAPGDPFVIRRRPLIASYPVGNPKQGVSLAFNEVNINPLPGADDSKNVIYKHWVYDNGSIVLPPSQVSYPNKTNIDAGKPAPLRGRDAPYIRRCYADESPIVGAPPDRIRAYDDLNPGPPALTVDSIPIGGTGTVGRPASSYLLHDDGLGNLTDYLTVTWEKRPTSNDLLRIWIGVE